MPKIILFLILLISIISFIFPKVLGYSYLTLKPDLITPTPAIIPTVQIGLMGDLGLGRLITSTARAKKDFAWSFSGVTDWLTQNDLNVANLESPIINNCPTVTWQSFTFCGDPQFLPQLKKNKFIFNLSNNHILNYGSSGLMETQKYLNEYQIPYVYSHSNSALFTVITINDISFGFLGFDLTGGHKVNQDNILTLVEKYNFQADWLVVSLHWGNEYLKNPEKWRVDLAHSLVDRGADIIHGHHPHVLQQQESYKDKLIFYSMGNFIFDQNWSQATSQSQMIRLTLSKNQVKKTDIVPITIKNNARPEINTP